MSNAKLKRRPPAKRRTSEERDAADMAVVTRALRKLKNNEALTQREEQRLNAFRARKDADKRWSYYEKVSLKDWEDMADKKRSQLKAQAALYGLPFGGATTNLRDFIHAFHEFLAENSEAFRLFREVGSDPNLLRAPREEQLKYVMARRILTESKTEKVDLELADMRADMLPRQEVRDFMMGVAAYIREASETLERKFGREAKAVLTDTCELIREEVEKTAAARIANNGRKR